MQSNADFSNSVGKRDMVECTVLKKKHKRKKQVCFFSGLSVQLLMVLIAGLDDRMIITSFSLWLI